MTGSPQKCNHIYVVYPGMREGGRERERGGEREREREMAY